MPKNYVLIQRVELTKTAASITFNNLPQTGFTDLKIVMSARGDGASGSFICQFNGATTNLSSKVLYGINGSAVGSGSYSDENSIWGYTTNSGSTANTFNNAEILIPKYTSNNNKSVSIDAVNETNASDGRQIITAGLWSSTAAITSITLYSKTGSNVATNFTQYSTFSIYGLAALGTIPSTAPKAIGGNSVLSDGTYWYHTFTSSGMFIPKTTLSCDYLVIGGGGSGGGSAGGSGGGGGAGGYRTPTAQSLSAATLVLVGGGATGGVIGGGTTGTRSAVGSYSASGGGAGTAGGTGGSGGSGGGAGGVNGAAANGGSGNSGGYSPSEGNNGGNSVSGTNKYAAGGGGGAGAVGGNATTNTSGGAGGAGSNSVSSWASVTSTGVSGYYAGGGGGGGGRDGGQATNISGGTGGSGGGGTAGSTAGTDGSSATANTGSGGGGAGYDGNPKVGGNGGSGLVIIRYAV
jgi:hypothetical protein